MSSATPSFPSFAGHIRAALDERRYVSLQLSGPTGRAADLKSVDIARVTIKREDKLSFTYHYKTKDIVKNHAPEEGLRIIGAMLDTDFRAGVLHTITGDIVWPSMKQTKPRYTEVPSSSHDRAKNRHVDPSRPYLQALKITDEKGSVYKNAQDKYRQIDKYIEILGGLIGGQPEGAISKIVDMGSGKGYLTFALYDYLHQVMKRPAQITGVEYRQDMVDLCNRIAKEQSFNALHFARGSIEEYDATGTNLLIALHACDTATDDAIAKGIQAGATLIVVAPCCHKQIRREMEKADAPGDLEFLLKYGTYQERQAEMVTDGLRALILNYCGYSTKLFEFVSDAHTPKNVMIVATRQPQGKKDEKALQKFRQAKKYWGIGQHYLETLLNLPA